MNLTSHGLFCVLLSSFETIYWSVFAVKTLLFSEVTIFFKKIFKMKIALIGYGKMGQAIEALAPQHEIVLKVDKDNADDWTIEQLAQADVAIEFSLPHTAFDNLVKCFDANVPVVCGTTGWLKRRADLEKICLEKKGGFFYASNFSIGVNIFFQLNKILAKMMDQHTQYQISLEEIHHTQKLDAPSGTAITLAEGILENLERKKGWVKEQTIFDHELPIHSKRIGKVPGTHSITYSSPFDDIEITHTAHSREGFAVGAIKAAEWMVGKQGIYGMEDMLKMIDS